MVERSGTDYNTAALDQHMRDVDAAEAKREALLRKFPRESFIPEAWERFFDEPSYEALTKLSEDYSSATKRVLLRALSLGAYIGRDTLEQKQSDEDRLMVWIMDWIDIEVERLQAARIEGEMS